MDSWDVAYTGKIERATGTKSFRFDRPDGLSYLPGQYFFLSIPKDGTLWLRHHFSFSSSPTEPFVEFTTRMTGSEFKNTMDALMPGTVVGIEGPEGDFVVRPGVRKVLYLCGGIGVTPVRSTIRWAADTGAELDIVLIYGNRDAAATAFKDELDAIGAENIRVIHVLSEPEAGWTGLAGLIDADLVRAQVPDWAERYVYVSGPPGMVDAMATMLTGQVGVGPERLMIEHFTGY